MSNKNREELRGLGQFWTPAWIAKVMVAYFLDGKQKELFDPAVGAGAFYVALKELDKKRQIKFYGTDIDQGVIKEAFNHKIFDNKSVVEMRDFIKEPPMKTFPAIIANPPYIRHHRLSTDTKKLLKQISYKYTGCDIDGRAGIHIYFLIQSLGLLENGGKLSFIMPSDTCEGVFAKKLWSWIGNNYCIEKVVTFESEATPFPNIDTNAIIFFISKNPRQSVFEWIRVKKESDQLLNYLLNKNCDFSDLEIIKRDTEEALFTGMSRRPTKKSQYKYRLSDFAKVIRGIASGANDYFFITRQKAEELGIPSKYFKLALGRTRDVEGNIITANDLKKLEEKGRPTLLLSLDNQRKEDLPKSLRDYIEIGEKNNLQHKALISTRNPWYKMEKRESPKFLFAYLGRRNARFVMNQADVIPLTSFLCVYPLSDDEKYINKLWQILNNPKTINNLKLVGKSYGSGAVKVEPKSLANLPIPEEVIMQAGIEPIYAKEQQKTLQKTLFEFAYY
ncbi:SAM-dependent methyltransferase [Patescibacteria group bacterium]|nr:SAM-dependent methyltransferase [Patescibacteria group bacterium]MBU4016352.1 SAM-dependent methyltransferase [Patescibacteria group bacterium]MBU4098767.1 SAM-dependent methyltransferase [Patescibacteria group bacterium]